MSLAHSHDPRAAGHDRVMADGTEHDISIHGAPTDGADGHTHPARLARYDGIIQRTERGWTWRGRLPVGAIAPLLRSASRGQPEPLQGPPDTPARVWLRAVWFDAETGTVTCEIAATDAAAAWLAEGPS